MPETSPAPWLRVGSTARVPQHDSRSAGRGPGRVRYLPGRRIWGRGIRHQWGDPVRSASDLRVSIERPADRERRMSVKVDGVAAGKLVFQVDPNGSPTKSRSTGAARARRAHAFRGERGNCRWNCRARTQGAGSRRAYFLFRVEERKQRVRLRGRTSPGSGPLQPAPRAAGKPFAGNPPAAAAPHAAVRAEPRPVPCRTGR